MQIEFNDEKYKKINRIGYGTYSKCYLYESVKNSNERIVLKKIPKGKISEKQFNNEKRIHKIINNNPGVIKYLGCFSTEKVYYLILEPGEIDLFEYMQKNGPLNEEKVKDLFKNVFNAIYFMHSKRIIHNDIKLENIIVFVDKEKKEAIKICDFGISKIMESKNYKKKCGTYYYSAPEQISKCLNSFASDIYSLGVTLYATLTGTFPYQGDNEYKYIINVLNSPPDIQPLKENNVSSETINLLMDMMNKNPNNRPSITNVIKILYK